MSPNVPVAPVFGALSKHSLNAASDSCRPSGGYGLIGMRERVETLGGTLHAGPRPDAGWSVRATLPIHSGRSR